MKISYAITVYNEYKEIDNLLFHLSKHIRDEDEVVVTRDVSKVGSGVFEPEFQALEKVLEKYEKTTQKNNVQVIIYFILTQTKYQTKY